MRLRPLPQLLLRMRLRLLPRLCPKLCGTETSSDDSTSTGYWPGNWLPSGTARGSTWWNAGGTNPTGSGQAESELGVGGGIELGVDGCTRHGELGSSGGAQKSWGLTKGGSAELELGVDACSRHGGTTAATKATTTLATKSRKAMSCETRNGNTWKPEGARKKDLSQYGYGIKI